MSSITGVISRGLYLISNSSQNGSEDNVGALKTKRKDEISKLPDDCLRLVLSYFDDKNMINIGRVNSRFYSITLWSSGNHGFIRPAHCQFDSILNICKGVFNRQIKQLSEIKGGGSSGPDIDIKKYGNEHLVECFNINPKNSRLELLDDIKLFKFCSVLNLKSELEREKEFDEKGSIVIKEVLNYQNIPKGVFDVLSTWDHKYSVTVIGYHVERRGLSLDMQVNQFQNTVGNILKNILNKK